MFIYKILHALVMGGKANELKNVVHVIFPLPCVVEKFRKQKVKSG